jgi:hypothetical protein
MIERSVEELAPIIGTRPGLPGARRRAGDDLPPSPAARAQTAEAQADAGQGAVGG